MSLANIPNALSVENIASEKSKNTSIIQNLRYVFSHLTLEPLLFLYVVAFITGALSSQNLSMEKACRVNLRYNDTICDAILLRNLSGYEPWHEAEVQKLVTQWSAYKSIFVGSLPVILMMFLGSWSDRHFRRKPIILLPIFGDLLGAVGGLICSIFFYELPLQFNWFSETVFPSIFGSWGCVALGVYSYVSSISSDEDRTMKIGTVSMCQTIAMSLGIFISGIVINKLGFKGVYSVSSSMMLVAFLYGYFSINEKKTKIKKDNVEEKKERKGFFRDFFALEHIRNTFMVCFSGGAKRRKQMILSLVISFLIFGPLQGEINIVYLYIRLKCGWNEVDYSFYNSIHFVIQILGNTLSLSLFTKILKFKDATLGMIAICSKIAASLIYAFAQSGTWFYVGGLVEIFYGTVHMVLRSIMSKIVPPHELGQSNSVFGICESIMPLMFGPLYSTIYMKTLNIFPGAFLLVSTVSYVFALLMFFCLYNATEDFVEKTEPVEVTKKLLQEKEDVDRKQTDIKV